MQDVFEARDNNLYRTSVFSTSYHDRASGYIIEIYNILYTNTVQNRFAAGVYYVALYVNLCTTT